MVVGIPYPHAKDSKVALKKEYNNVTSVTSNRSTPGYVAAQQRQFAGSSKAPPRLLTGDAWYSQQAFRALNQVNPLIRALLVVERSSINSMSTASTAIAA